EYIFPNSSAAALQESDLLNLSAKQLRIAKNEIYARHGRLFADAELQSYFNGCSWYRGRIEPDEFDEGLLSEQEKANISMIQSRQ
uniref:YARHG domain-containing protein n=1 Tax=Eisenbergiella sp. TaxID=1924109 RepID=UPI003AB3FDF9